MHKTALAALIAMTPMTALAEITPEPMLIRIMCFEAEPIAKALKAKYGETVTQVGTRSTGEVVLIFQNTDTGTFTIGYIRTDGKLCAMASGEQWDMPGLTRGDGL